MKEMLEGDPNVACTSAAVPKVLSMVIWHADDEHFCFLNSVSLSAATNVEQQRQHAGIGAQ